MVRFVNWICRVPTWVWLLLATTQVLTIISRATSIPNLKSALANMPSHEAYQDMHAIFQEILWRSQVDLVGAIVLCSLFTALAIAGFLKGPRQVVEMSEQDSSQSGNQ